MQKALCATIIMACIHGAFTSEMSMNQICKGEYLSISKGLCTCTAAGHPLDPWSERDIYVCKKLSSFHRLCTQNSSKMAWVNNHCFCKGSREFADAKAKPYVDEMLEPNISFNADSFRDLEKAIDLCPANKPEKEYYGGTVEGEMKETEQGIVYELRRVPHKSWGSGTNAPIVQGNPLFAAGMNRAMGLDLGIDEKNEEVVVIPGTHLFLKRYESWIDRWASASQKSQQKDASSPILFYPVEGIVDVQTYRDNFAYHKKLPVSLPFADGNLAYLIHDLVYHSFSAFLLSNEFVDHVQKQFREVHRFERYFSQHDPVLYEKIRQKAGFYRLNAYMVQNWDTYSGDISNYFLGLSRILKGETAVTAKGLYDWSLSNWPSGTKILQDKAEEWIEKIVLYFYMQILGKSMVGAQIFRKQNKPDDSLRGLTMETFFKNGLLRWPKKILHNEKDQLDFGRVLECYIGKQNEPDFTESFHPKDRGSDLSADEYEKLVFNPLAQLYFKTNVLRL